MRTLGMVATFGLACWVVGCAGRGDPAGVRLSGTGPTVRAVEPAQGGAALPGGPESDATDQPAQSADPTYTEPTLGVMGPGLEVETDGPYRMRTWPTRTVPFKDGPLVHMPRWFADPYDEQTMHAPDQFGWGRDDLIALACGPGRFLVNLVALPVSMVVHPCWRPEHTDRTATVVQTETGVEVLPLAPAKGK